MPLLSTSLCAEQRGPEKGRRPPRTPGSTHVATVYLHSFAGTIPLTLQEPCTLGVKLQEGRDQPRFSLPAPRPTPAQGSPVLISPSSYTSTSSSLMSMRKRILRNCK